MGCRTRLLHVIAQKTGREERQNELYRKSSCVLDTKRHILKSAGGFPCHRFDKKLNEDVTKVCTLKKIRKEILTVEYYGEADNVFYLDITLQIQCFFTAFFSVHTTKTCFEGSIS